MGRKKKAVKSRVASRAAARLVQVRGPGEEENGAQTTTNESESSGEESMTILVETVDNPNQQTQVSQEQVPIHNSEINIAPISFVNPPVPKVIREGEKMLGLSGDESEAPPKKRARNTVEFFGADNSIFAESTNRVTLTVADEVETGSINSKGVRKSARLIFKKGKEVLMEAQVRPVEEEKDLSSTPKVKNKSVEVVDSFPVVTENNVVENTSKESEIGNTWITHLHRRYLGDSLIDFQQLDYWKVRLPSGRLTANDISPLVADGAASALDNLLVYETCLCLVRESDAVVVDPIFWDHLFRIEGEEEARSFAQKINHFAQPRYRMSSFKYAFAPMLRQGRWRLVYLERNGDDLSADVNLSYVDPLQHVCPFEHLLFDIKNSLLSDIDDINKDATFNEIQEEQFRIHNPFESGVFVVNFINMVLSGRWVEESFAPMFPKWRQELYNYMHRKIAPIPEGGDPVAGQGNHDMSEINVVREDAVVDDDDVVSDSHLIAEPVVPFVWQDVRKRDRRKLYARDRRAMETAEEKELRLAKQRLAYRRKKEGLGNQPIEDDAVEEERRRKELRNQLIAAKKAMQNCKHLLNNETVEQFKVRRAQLEDRQIEIEKQISEGLRGAAFIDSGKPTTDVSVSLLTEGRICPHFSATLLPSESNGFCCQNGQVDLHPLPPEPQEWRDLMFHHEDSQHIREKYRSYNNAISPACFNVQTVLNVPGDWQSYKVTGTCQGQITHLNPPEEGNGRRQYAQLFMFDVDKAVRHRNNICNNSLKAPILRKYERLARRDHPYCQAFVMAYQQQRQTIADAERDGIPIPKIEMQLIDKAFQPGQTEEDIRRVYSNPQRGDISAVYTTDDAGYMRHPGATVLRANSAYPKVLTYNSPHYDPMAYVLLFPLGTLGWGANIRRAPNPNKKKESANPRTRISLREFWCHRFQYRDIVRPGYAYSEKDSLMFHGKSLTQQLGTDQFIKIDNQRLDEITKSQKNLKMMNAQDGIDMLNGDADLETEKVGFSSYLPPSHAGSPRYYQEFFKKVMAMVGEFGLPAYFITFTANPEWEEFKELKLVDNKETGEKAKEKVFERPDLAARICQAKWQRFKQCMFADQILGKVIAAVDREEDQQRGLLHWHSVWWIHARDCPKLPAEFDNVICAELPSKDDKELLELVLKHMIHGPCSLGGKYKNCKPDPVRKRCGRHYPMQFSHKTIIDESNHPIYRRRNDGHTETNRYGTVDNRWVIPYNPWMLKTFKCHINVERPSSLATIKYLMKYILKNADNVYIRFTCSLAQHLDKEFDESGQKRKDFPEIEWFKSARITSSMCALSRIFGFSIVELTHGVHGLPIHDKDQQIVPIDFDKDMPIEDNIQGVVDRDTQLTAFFKLCSLDPLARQLLYKEVVRWFCWVPAKKKWQRRCHGYDTHTLARLNHVSPRDRDRFFIRMALNNIRGPTSFEDLRTDQYGVVHPTYEAALQARGLLEDDAEWANVLNEANLQGHMPRALRSLFVALITHCRVLRVGALFEQFKDRLSDDFKRFGKSRYERALRQIDSILLYQNSSRQKMNLPEPDPNIEEDLDKEDDDEYRAEHLQRFTELSDKFNECQQDFANEFDMAQLHPNDPNYTRLFYLQGAAGTGKTYLLNAIISYLIGNRVPVVVSASTGIAATLLTNGRTAHSSFGIPLEINEDSMTCLKMRTETTEALRDAEIIIIDEISQMSKHCFRLIDRATRDLGDPNVLFGCKTVIFGGDFKQLLPVVNAGSQYDIIDACFLESELWEHFKVMTLTKNERAGKNQKFSEWLHKLGTGELNDENNEVVIPQQCIVDSEDALIESVFDFNNPEIDPNVALLAPRHRVVDRMNDKILHRIYPHEQIHPYYSADTALDDDPMYAGLIDIEHFHDTTPSGFPLHELKLKVGAICILLRNLNLKEGLCNGTRVLIKQLGAHVIQAEVLTGISKGNLIFIPRIDFIPTAGCRDTMPFRRRQYPLKLAFAMTINKAQGQTLDRAAIHLRDDVFAHGQLYVAISRVRSLDSLKIFCGHGSDEDGEYRVSNIVYPEIIDSIKAFNVNGNFENDDDDDIVDDNGNDQEDIYDFLDSVIDEVVNLVGN